MEERNGTKPSFCSLQAEGNGQIKPRKPYLPLRNWVWEGTGMVTMWGNDFSHITCKSFLQQGEDWLCPPIFLPSHHSALQDTSLLQSIHIGLSLCDRQSLSLFFVFTCSAFPSLNKMYRSHPVTTEWYLNHVSGMHVLPRVSSDAAWSTADMCYLSSPNPSPLEVHA